MSDNAQAFRNMADEALTEDLRRALQTEPLLLGSAIHIGVVGGVIRLTGTVSHVAQRELALRRVATAAGAGRTTDLLVLRPQRTRSAQASAAGATARQRLPVR